MKLIFTILLLLFSAITLPLFAQNLPTLPINGREVADFVPAGWKIAEKLDGDLDSDGAAEIVLVLRGTDQALIKSSEYLDFNVMIKDEVSGDLQWMADNNPVILAVLSKEKDVYRLTAHNHQIIPRFVDSWYRWKHSVSLKDKTLQVELMGKISSGIRDNFGETRLIYKFQARNSRLVLTEAEETFWYQAMLAANGRKDRYRKLDFLKNKGFIVSTVSIDRQSAQEELRRIDDLIPFENVTADEIEKISKIETVAAEDFRAPAFTGEEISRKVLQLIKNIGRIAEISPDNLEKTIGGTIVFDAENRNIYGYAGKISDSDWFYQIFSLTESNGEKPIGLEFSFNNTKNDDAELQKVCKFSYADYEDELIKTGFTVKPFYGEHGRLLYWQFKKNKVELKIETVKDKQQECVKTLRFNVLE